MFKTAERPAAKKCMECINRCKQDPSFTIVWCRDFTKSVATTPTKH